MDLKIKDVAELLNVSETTIRRWLAEGIIPAYRLNHQFRFSREEIQNWVMSCRMNRVNEESVPQKISLNDGKAETIIGHRMGTQAYSLFRALYKGSVLDDIASSTKEEVIEESVQIIAKNLSLDADVLSELLLDRERLMPTGLNHGVAVPHTRDFLLQKPYDVVTVVYPQEPIEYGSLDGQKVHTLFFLFASSDKSHLHLLAKLAHFTRQDRTLAFLKQKPGKNALLEYAKTWEATLRPAEEGSSAEILS
jgi:PTS system nitrogen regulatory IIA component